MRLVIRADASARIGLGHLSRTSAVAEAARRQGIEPTLLVYESDTHFSRLARE